MLNEQRAEIVLRAHVELVNVVFNLKSTGGIDFQALLEDDQKCLKFQQEVGKALGMVSPRERQVLIMRYGLNGNDPLNLENTGAQLLRQRGSGVGVSKERARQIEARAIRRFRHPTRSRGLREFFPEEP